MRLKRVFRERRGSAIFYKPLRGFFVFSSLCFLAFYFFRIFVFVFFMFYLSFFVHFFFCQLSVLLLFYLMLSI